MPDKTWKAKERRAAKIFGTCRQVGSGSLRVEGRSRSDSDHESLYIETKHRKSSSVRSLYDQTARLAKSEGKTPVLMLFDKGKPGGLLVLHEKDIETVLSTYLEARRDQNSSSLGESDPEALQTSLLSPHFSDLPNSPRIPDADAPTNNPSIFP